MKVKNNRRKVSEKTTKVSHKGNISGDWPKVKKVFTNFSGKHLVGGGK